MRGAHLSTDPHRGRWPRRLWRSLIALTVLGTLLAASQTTSTAFGGLTDEAVSVWQHRDTESPTGWDIWYSVLGRPAEGDPSSSLAWHSASGGAAAPVATLPGDDKNPHVFINAGRTIAVWQHQSAPGAVAGNWEIFWAEMASNGIWTAPSPVQDIPIEFNDFDPNVSVDSNGNALAVWVRRGPTGVFEIVSSELTGSTWTPSGARAVGITGGHASLPEVHVTSVPAAGGTLAHRFVASWSDTPVAGAGFHRMLSSTFDGLGWSVPVEIESPATGIPVSIDDVAFANYSAADPDPFGAEFRQGVTADASGDAYVIWGGSASSGFPGVVGAILHVATGTWDPMLTPFASRFIGVGGCHSPDDALTTGGGDFSGVFPFAGFIEDTFRTGGAFTPESFAYDSPQDDLRPSNAAVSATEMISVNWGGPQGFSSEIHWSVGTVDPGTDIAWSTAATVVPGTLDGEDMFPELSSGFTGRTITGGLSLDPPTDSNPTGTDHTVTATATLDGQPASEVRVDFVVTGANSATGFCITGADGTCTFTYTGTNPGLDTITATAVIADKVQTATATKEWFAADADLFLEKADFPDPVEVGELLSYSILVKNLGPGDAHNVEVVDNIPHEMHFVAAMPSQGTCTLMPGNHLHCHLGTIEGPGAPSTDAAIGIQVRPERVGVFVNAACVHADENDPNQDNNCDQEPTTVIRHGGFTCRATALRINSTEVATANPPNSPCVDDFEQVLGVPGPPVTAGVLQGHTEQEPDDLAGTVPTVGDHARADASVAQLLIKVGNLTVRAGVLSAFARAECTEIDHAPTLTSGSSIATLQVTLTMVVFGRPVAVNIPVALTGHNHVVIPGIATLHVNHQSFTANSVTQRALWLESPILNVVAGEAIADFEGRPCHGGVVEHHDDAHISHL